MHSEGPARLMVEHKLSELMKIVDRVIVLNYGELIAEGTPEQVKAATRRVLEKLAPYGGLIIQDGNNIPPGSPMENINAMMDASKEYG